MYSPIHKGPINEHLELENVLGDFHIFAGSCIIFERDFDSFYVISWSLLSMPCCCPSWLNVDFSALWTSHRDLALPNLYNVIISHAVCSSKQMKNYLLINICKPLWTRNNFILNRIMARNNLYNWFTGKLRPISGQGTASRRFRLYHPWMSWEKFLLETVVSKQC